MSKLDSSTPFAPLSTHLVNLPEHLLVKVTKSDLLGERRSFGFDGEQFFGTAFIQGRRLQFTTAMPLSTMIRVSKIDQAKRASGVHEVMERANRPKIAGHAKALRQYFLDTACIGEKFILPAFAFNFGDESTTPEDAPEATLWIYADEKETTTNGWPALLQLPTSIKLDTTDGGHRGGEIRRLLDDVNDRNVTEQQRFNLGRNACDVKIIFESKRIDAHQDFADCAKAKPITGSLISTFDVRDIRNKRAVELVAAVPFLLHYVDATAANVNLSSASLKIWSMSAIRGFVGHIQDRYPPEIDACEQGERVVQSLDERMEGAEEFFAAIIKHLPPLHTLDLARVPGTGRNETAPSFRNKRGGNILFRGVAMSLFARAFIYCKQEGLTFDEMGRRLAQVEWHLLDCERDELSSSTTAEGREEYPEAVEAHLNPLWASMIVIGENRYRISSTSDEVNRAWERIVGKFPQADVRHSPRPQVKNRTRVAVLASE